MSFPSPLRTVKIIYALVSVRFAFILSPSTFSGYRTPNKYHRRRLFFFTINNSFLFFRFHLVPKYRIKKHDDSTNASNFKYVLCDLKKKKKSLFTRSIRFSVFIVKNVLYHVNNSRSAKWIISILLLLLLSLCARICSHNYFKISYSQLYTYYVAQHILTFISSGNHLHSMGGIFLARWQYIQI